MFAHESSAMFLIISLVLLVFILGLHVLRELLADTRSLQSLSWIYQGMSWQHLHQPCVAGKV